jgi:Beta-lactamase enzyme family
MRRKLTAAVIGGALVTTLAIGASPTTTALNDDELAEGLLAAVQSVAFDEVVDFEFDTPDGPAPQVANTPNVDVAVIELDDAGNPIAAANVLLSRDFPDGRIVALDDGLGATGIDWQAWDIARWDGDWDATTPPSIVPAQPGSDAFMVPYPASTFKLLVAFHTLRLVDEGVIGLDAEYKYRRERSDTCLGEKVNPLKTTTRQMLDDMITFSSNNATCVLLKQLHDLGQIDAMNAGFAELGLGTLQVNGTDRGAGGTWNPGSIHMTAIDTARLLLIVNGTGGELWTAPNGSPVVADEVLSPTSQGLLLDLLAQQGFNEVLSTTNWCGADYPVQGIPATVASRWVDPADGTVTVDGIPYFQDVRDCNDTAEVAFAHKTGLTYNYGSDAGIVRSIEEGGRHYVVAVFTNLGYRYSDASEADEPDLPCFTSGVCYTEKFAELGKAIDELLR